MEEMIEAGYAIRHNCVAGTNYYWHPPGSPVVFAESLTEAIAAAREHYKANHKETP